MTARVPRFIGVVLAMLALTLLPIVGAQDWGIGNVDVTNRPV